MRLAVNIYCPLPPFCFSLNLWSPQPIGPYSRLESTPLNDSTGCIIRLDILVTTPKIWSCHMVNKLVITIEPESISKHLVFGDESYTAAFYMQHERRVFCAFPFMSGCQMVRGGQGVPLKCLLEEKKYLHRCNSSWILYAAVT